MATASYADNHADDHADTRPLTATNLADVEYGRAGGTTLLLDGYIPPGSGPFPAVVLVHGGGWVTGDRRNSVQPLFQPLAQAGFAWFSISYRLAGDIHKKPQGDLLSNGASSLLMLGTAVDDVRTAIRFIKQHASEYRIDPSRMALVGESAGGQLASMAALRPAPDTDVRAVVAFYSPSDLAELAKSSERVPDSVRQAIKGTPWESLLLGGLRELSPVTWVSKQAPPFLLIHGTADTLVPFGQSTEMCNKLNAAGGICKVYPVRGAGHGMRWWESGSETAYKRVMIEWLEQQLTSRV